MEEASNPDSSVTTQKLATGESLAVAIERLYAYGVAMLDKKRLKKSRIDLYSDMDYGLKDVNLFVTHEELKNSKSPYASAGSLLEPSES